MYRDPYDVAAERAAKAQREQDEVLAENRAELRERDARGRGLYRDARALKGDELVRAECAQVGIRNERDILEAQARVRAADAALLAENPELSPTEYLDVLKAPSRPLTPEALAAREELVVANHAIPVYRTKSAVRELIADANATLPAERPLLNQRLRERGGAVSPPVLHALINTAAERKDGALRASAAGKPFGRVPAASAKPTDPGPDWAAIGRHPAR